MAPQSCRRPFWRRAAAMRVSVPLSRARRSASTACSHPCASRQVMISRAARRLRQRDFPPSVRSGADKAFRAYSVACSQSCPAARWSLSSIRLRQESFPLPSDWQETAERAIIKAAKAGKSIFIELFCLNKGQKKYCYMQIGLLSLRYGSNWHNGRHCSRAAFHHASV